jgi:hypothetical protein
MGIGKNSSVARDITLCNPADCQQIFRRKISSPSSGSKEKLNKKPEWSRHQAEHSWYTHIPPKCRFTISGLHGLILKKIVPLIATNANIIAKSCILPLYGLQFLYFVKLDTITGNGGVRRLSSMCLSVGLCVCLPARLSTRLSICLSIDQSVCAFISPSLKLYLYLFICGSTVLFSDLGQFFSFLNEYTIGKTPWTRD